MSATTPFKTLFWSGDVGHEITEAGARADLKGLRPKTELRIHLWSCGGSVFEAAQIAGVMDRWSGKVVVVIDSIAASAATMLACAADEVIMGRSAVYMIHNPRIASLQDATSKELRQIAEACDKAEEIYATEYARRSGGKLTVEKARQLMDGETYLTAAECLELGLCEKVDDRLKSKAKETRYIHPGIITHPRLAAIVRSYNPKESFSTKWRREYRARTLEEARIRQEIDRQRREAARIQRLRDAFGFGDRPLNRDAMADQGRNPRS